jgi:CubicO group peptidase (beta-lactamase class C family)
VKSILPELDNPLHGEITIWHLLTHTSGLPPDPGYLCEPYPLPRFEWWRLEQDWIRKAVASGPAASRPGEAWGYCSMGYMLLAEVVSRVSGVPYYDHVVREILAPLGMGRSMFAVPEPLRSEVAWCEDWQRGDWVADHPDGSGGLFSTLPDLFRFGQCFLQGGELEGRRILGRKTVEEMTRNQLSGVPAFHWGKRLRDYRHGLGDLQPRGVRLVRPVRGSGGAVRLRPLHVRSEGLERRDAGHPAGDRVLRGAVKRKTWPFTRSPSTPGPLRGPYAQGERSRRRSRARSWGR